MVNGRRIDGDAGWVVKRVLCFQGGGEGGDDWAGDGAFCGNGEKGREFW